MSKFDYVDRAKQKDIVLLPGWATDARVFEKLDINYNYYLPRNFTPCNFEEDIINLMKERNLEKISILGWSLGGFAAADFAAKYPEKMEKLILIGVKKRYDPKDVEKIKQFIKQGKSAYLYKFYNDCFSKEDQDEHNWFKQNLQKDYIDSFDINHLINDLDYIVNRPLDLVALKDLDVFFVHGTEDKIAPVDEIIELKDIIKAAESYIFIKGAGHAPFLKNPKLGDVSLFDYSN